MVRWLLILVVISVSSDAWAQGKARLTGIWGTVTVGGLDQAPRVGDTVTTDDLVRTGSASAALLELGTVALSLGADAEIRIENAVPPYEVRLNSGDVRIVSTGARLRVRGPQGQVDVTDGDVVLRGGSDTVVLVLRGQATIESSTGIGDARQVDGPAAVQITYDGVQEPTVLQGTAPEAEWVQISAASAFSHGAEPLREKLLSRLSAVANEEYRKQGEPHVPIFSPQIGAGTPESARSLAIEPMGQTGTLQLEWVLPELRQNEVIAP